MKIEEKKFVFMVSLVIILTAFIPVIVGYINQTEDMRFMGLIRVVDSNTYFDYMNQRIMVWMF